MASYPEAARERDLHRYYRPWLDAQTLVGADGIGIKGLSYEGYRPQAGRDRSLTAFTQLAALRLDTRRAMVSLIDSHRQYILAEATRTSSLFAPTAERPEDEVWLGNAILNKFDAVCHHTFSSTYVAKEEDSDETLEAPCMVIPDCRLDPRFADKDYVRGEPGVRFYAGVPITTKAGHRIGVYAVSDERPREGITASDVRFMQDVAAAVMEHLELAKDSDDRIKGERMVRGLTQFIERSSALDSRGDTGTRATTTMERQTENARLETLDEEDDNVAAGPASTVKQAQQRKGDNESDVTRIFQRAARIVRQSTDADGVVFFDTSTASIKGQLHDFSRNAPSSDESGTHNTTDFDTGDSTTSKKRRRHIVTVPEGSAEAVLVISKACPVAGLSLRDGNTALVHADFAFTESAMERYIHRYPYGKFFNYNEEGVGINSSDEKSQTSETDQSDRTMVESSLGGQKKSRRRREKFIPTEFLKVLPNVRTLIFLPLWDPSSERWVAGGFIWTTVSGRLMSPENELPYLQAFGNSIASEVARLTAQRADKAKTTFIASISHELRSPLHGILGSVEFLRDTVSSAYQESLVSSIETCGKTLLDTIDHVLDYAKINRLRSVTARRKQRGHKRLPADNSILGVTADFDLAQLVEEVCDTVCAGHTFRKTHSANGGAIYDQAENNITNARNSHSFVVVSLIVAPFVSWYVRSQPGALRRIVMNLLGNALKYTDSGFIAITLQQSTANHHAIDLALSIEDSGRGMSTDYQRTKLFSPFSQEDPFSSGTGLGLSIVKQIVESLEGEIEVKSTLNVGTQIRIVMRLPKAQNNNVEGDHALQAATQLRGLSVRIMMEVDTHGGDRGVKIKQSMQRACEGFDMIVSETREKSIPEVDFLLTDSASLDKMLQNPSADRNDKGPLPVVCICMDTAEKSAVEARLGRHMSSLSWIVDFVTQPCGPRKLAGTLLACRNRAFDNQQSERPRLLHSETTLPVLHHDHESLGPGPNAFTQRSRSEVYPHGKTTPPNEPGMPSPLPVQQLPTTITPPSPGQVGGGGYFSPRVLLVDDNAINLKLLVVFAKRQSLQYSEATNGLEAIETYKHKANYTDPPVKPFDFILMDLTMPVMDGLTSTRQIRAYEKKKGLQRSTIVALTGLASAQDQQDASDAGVDMYLVKPVKFADIRRIFGGK
ncbi:sensor histidine kinase-like protein/response regulator [Setomelanomma holmii]|uniref:histidine kinase n=1 Tax=Setomelanomma holmii TaxID=210430 RepID=A0A9P4LN66_9PLEO|nr:sensor histidine kinase-like protein/response regulator [Setomelanomma holmii]